MNEISGNWAGDVFREINNSCLFNRLVLSAIHFLLLFVIMDSSDAADDAIYKEATEIYDSLVPGLTPKERSAILLKMKSKDRYIATYDAFKEWHIREFKKEPWDSSQDIYLKYISSLIESEKYGFNSLRSKWSMLKSMHQVNCGSQVKGGVNLVDKVISNYSTNKMVKQAEKNCVSLFSQFNFKKRSFMNDSGKIM